MTPTEIKLVAIHKSPAIRLMEVSQRYLGVDADWATRQAKKNLLPFPTFRLNEPKGPLMVTTADLAAHIDSRHDSAQKAWTQSQV